MKKKKKKLRIRPLAICVFQNGDHIFVAKGYDSIKQQTFFRPLGGQIEFGEHATETIERELMEEIGAEVTDLVYLGTLENIFTFEGEQGHEIIMIFDGKFTNQEIYKQTTLIGLEGTGKNQQIFDCLWLQLTSFNNTITPLYPSGLLELLTQRK